MLEPGTYLWTSPHGYQLLRDGEGTLDVTPDRRPARNRQRHSPSPDSPSPDSPSPDSPSPDSPPPEE